MVSPPGVYLPLTQTAQGMTLRFAGNYADGAARQRLSHTQVALLDFTRDVPCCSHR